MRELRTPIIQFYYSATRKGESDPVYVFKAKGANPDDLRSSEKGIVTIEGVDSLTGEEFEAIATYDLRPNTSLEAGLGIGTTLFVCIVLASGALLFA